MTERPGSESLLSAITALLRRAPDVVVDETQKWLSRERLLARAEASLPVKHSRGYFALVACAATTVVVSVMFWLVWPRALSYDVTGARVEGPYISAAGETPATIHFSDDTRVTAHQGARLRVEEITARGARVVVERGRAHAHVQHRAGAEWTFVAGPFEVEVKGTRFRIDWEPSREAFDLELQEGAVNVRGPFAKDPISLTSGQSFHGDLGTRSMTVNDVGSRSVASMNPMSSARPSSAPSPSSEAPKPAGAPTGKSIERTAEHSSRSAAPSVRQDWPKLIVDGHFKTLVAQAEERGIAGCLADCSAGDLRALSDAARYTGRAGLAEQSLLALRKRFAASAHGRAAAFMLGRLYESQKGSAKAKGWYETYLAEAPNGNFAAEALAGKMRTALALGGRAAALPIAQQYLMRYPTGVHAQTAHSIAGSE